MERVKDLLARQRFFQSEHVILKRSWVFPIVIWTALVSVSLVWNLSSIKRQSFAIVEGQARVMFGLIEMTRLWNSQHGGVYVPVTADTPPNPYLYVEDREILTTKGKKFTLVNHAYMIRQIGELANEYDGALFHITSLKPIRPGNAPDEWETRGLKEFESRNKKETFDLIETGAGRSFRYMAALLVKEPCLRCHAMQGYKVGDVRGGISITLNADPVFESIHTQWNNVIALHIAFFIGVSVLMLYFISRRRKTDELLRESEMVLRSITQSVNEAIISADASGEIILWNNAAETIFGYTREEIVGRNITVLMPERYRAVHINSMNRFVKEGSSNIIGKILELHGLRKNDEEFPVEVLISNWTIKDGVFFTGVVRDITERKKLEANVTEKTRQLSSMADDLKIKVAEGIDKYKRQEQLIIQQSKMAAMGEMIGAIAHQWRQPLNAVGVLIQDLQDAQNFGELDKNYMDDAVERAMEQIQFMSGTIDDFRTFFKPSKEKTPFSLKQSFDEIWSIISAQLKNHQIDCQVICRSGGTNTPDVDMPCDAMTVIGYPNEFKHVIINIINNAKDAILECIEKEALSRDGGKIIMDVSKGDNSVIIVRIIDNGGGIPPHIKEKIFEPYFSTKGDAKGTGIGLYMSKVIIENNMDGRLYCENIENGTIFVIELAQHL
ncbi:MAG: DUF3365 domain-containing protein [Nitrospirae bacterium]|nr:DUF3365 domain-containing protein [Nitrospirota bacterium]